MSIRLKPSELYLLKELKENKDKDQSRYSTYDSELREAVESLHDLGLLDLEQNEYLHPAETYEINENGLRFLRNFIAVEWR